LTVVFAVDWRFNQRLDEIWAAKDLAMTNVGLAVRRPQNLRLADGCTYAQGRELVISKCPIRGVHLARERNSEQFGDNNVPACEVFPKFA